jgi:hypothetical protein
MTQANHDDAPGAGLFPQYGPDMYAMVASEVEGLTDEQLDWESDRWEWSKWSIRRQVSHMPSFVKGWLLQRWGDQLFPGGTSHLGEMAEYDRSPGGSWLNEDRFWDLPVLLEQWSSSIDLALHVLEAETVGSMRKKQVTAPGGSEFWRLAVPAHDTGVSYHPTDADHIVLTLEGTFRHIYYEFTTHLHNVLRLKRAQGLSTTVDVPREGYWVMSTWDRSEP